MRLPLLVGARPKFTAGGPLVMLEAGTWRFVVELLSDTLLSLHINNEAPVPLPVEIVCGENCLARVTIDKPGNELYINVFAMKST